MRNKKDEKRAMILSHLKRRHRRHAVEHKKKNMILEAKIIHAIKKFLIGIEMAQENEFT